MRKKALNNKICHFTQTKSRAKVVHRKDNVKVESFTHKLSSIKECLSWSIFCFSASKIGISKKKLAL